MASLSTDKNNNRRILFIDAKGKRRTIRLGKMPKKTAEAFKTKVEHLNAAKIANTPIDGETAQWLAGLSDEMHCRLVSVELTAARVKKQSVKLGAFVQEYLQRRTDIKERTRINLDVARRRLVEYFGAEKPLEEISQGQCDSWILWLKERYAKSTIGRTTKRAKQFFKAAVRLKHIASNPFEDIKPMSEVNKSREFFVSRQVIEAVIAAAPDQEWRLIIALCRFGGLRCPSELLPLRWDEVLWDEGKFLVRSPKTEHHEYGESRWVPIFPELRPQLEEAKKQAAKDAIHVIARYRNENANLRTQFQRIIKKAKQTSWPRLFQNLRASRETELTKTFPLHVVCAWIGNSAIVAQKHYLQVTQEDFKLASETPGDADSGAPVTQNQAQQAAAQDRTESQYSTQHQIGIEVVLADAILGDVVRFVEVPRVGLEPTTR